MMTPELIYGYDAPPKPGLGVCLVDGGIYVRPALLGSVGARQPPKSGELLFHIVAAFAQFERDLAQDKSRSVQEICKLLQISRATFYNYTSDSELSTQRTG
jgi:hypothetical protein